jgi:hypothetical protein
VDRLQARRLDDDEAAEDRRGRRIEVRQAAGRRRDERLLGTAGAAALAARGERQIAALARVGRLQSADDEQVYQQDRQERPRDQPAMAQHQPESAR